MNSLSRFFIKNWIPLLIHGFVLRHFSFLESLCSGACCLNKVLIWSKKTKAMLAKILFWDRTFCHGIFFKSFLNSSWVKIRNYAQFDSLQLDGGFLRKSFKYYKLEKMLWYLRCEIARVRTELYSIYKNILNQALRIFS